MAFSARCGLELDFTELGDDIVSISFNEELGVVLQCNESAKALIEDSPLRHRCYKIGKIRQDEIIRVQHQNKSALVVSRANCQRAWAKLSYEMQSLRDNPECADEEYAMIDDDMGLFLRLSFDCDKRINFNTNAKPKVAILREQGSNGHYEMAAAFMHAGFEATDVHMNDLAQASLNEFAGLAVCGGFSYGDVLGAGRGWAQRILHDERLRQIFADFFADRNRFVLGVCNGCQMLAQLNDLIPGAHAWPNFVMNSSQQYEARMTMVEITDSPSILLRGMQGSQIPIIVSHGEGRAIHTESSTVCMRYVDSDGRPTMRYPSNPNGSQHAVTGVCNQDGRITIMMPHPERLFRLSQFSWIETNQSNSPWLRMFDNAREFVR